MTLVVLPIASINFQLNLGYLFTFMLAGSAVIGMHISHATLRADAAFETAPTAIHGQQRGAGGATHQPALHPTVWHWHRRTVAMTHPPTPTTTGPGQMFAQGSSRGARAFQPQRRGLHPVPTLTAETRFPLGTFRVWNLLAAGPAAGVPGPESTPPPLPVGEPAPRARATPPARHR